MQERDEALMLRYQQGEAEAMNELLARYKDRVYRFCVRMSHNADEAQDIAQEVFVKVHLSRGQFDPSRRFSTWLFSIAHHAFVSRLRKNFRFVPWPVRHDAPDEPVEFASPQPSPDAVAAGNDVAALVRTCIARLPFLQKEALVLREYEQLDYEEIARILHTPTGTVKTLLHRARERLKVELLPYAQELQGGCHG